ncbi:MAG TPA: prepilin-type N-terminal cleavage/methylation domain-containing protein [Planctomycetota bacterium]|nr:prepilin-type N-terminal cleavage/methylation domain-containing protein [Planctomycetota bacterium]
MRSPAPSGFTLIEILASMAVLAIGLAAVVSMVLGSSRSSSGAVDRNTASVIIAEAIEDIERIHRITPELIQNNAALAGHENDIGCYMETYDTGPNGPTASEPWPNLDELQSSDYGVNGVITAHTGPLTSARYPIPSTLTGRSTMMVWPPTPEPKFYGGPMKQSGSGMKTTGLPYRVIYRLERHPEWVAVLALPPTTPPTVSAYEDIYVLTAAVYKDLDVGLSIASPLHRYEQISDPVVTFFRRKR